MARREKYRVVEGVLAWCLLITKLALGWMENRGPHHVTAEKIYDLVESFENHLANGLLYFI